MEIMEITGGVFDAFLQVRDYGWNCSKAVACL